MRLRLAGVVLLLAGLAAVVTGIRSARIVPLAVDTAGASGPSRVELSGGEWDCGSLIPRSVGLAAGELDWVPYRGGKQVALVGFDDASACEALPARPIGYLRRMEEPAYETLREHDLTRWATFPQARVLLLFPERGPHPSRTILVGGALGVIGGALTLAYAYRARMSVALTSAK